MAVLQQASPDQAPGKQLRELATLRNLRPPHDVRASSGRDRPAHFLQEPADGSALPQRTAALDGGPPSDAKVVRAMQAKIDGEEVLQTYITEAHASASGGELDLDADLAGTTVGDVKACLSDTHEMPVYFQRLFSGAMEVSECRLLAELVASGCESLLLVLNLDFASFSGIRDRARDDFALATGLGRMNTVRSFLEAGMPAKTLARDQRCLSVLMVACTRGQASVAELLVEHHAAMNTVWRPDSVRT